MAWWITSIDGEISFATRTASTADEARLELARKYGKASFAEFCEAADYGPGSFTVAEVRADPTPPTGGVGFIAAPPGLVEGAFLAMKAAVRR